MFNINRGEDRGELGPPPPPFRVYGQGGPRGIGPTERWLIIAGLVLVLFIVATVFRDIYTEMLWFNSVNYQSVYITIITTRIGLFVIGLVAFLVFLGINFFIAKSLSPQLNNDLFALDEIHGTRRLINLGVIATGAFLGIIFGSVAAGRWLEILRFRNGESFGVSDPIFSYDIGFYIFTLPFIRFLQGWILAAVLVTMVAVVLVYGFHLSLQRLNLLRVPVGIKVHLSVLGSLVFLMFSWGYLIDSYDLLRSSTGLVYGAGYTDVTARLFVYRVLIFISAVTAVCVLANIFMRGVMLPSVALVVWALVAVLGGNIYPSMVQRFQVEPNEFNVEEPYINHNIRMTRQAFGLESIEAVNFPALDAPSQQDIVANPDTINNVRLWDVEPLLATYNQIQSLRSYYDFVDVDVDRYMVDGRLRQVMLGTRELSPEKLPEGAQTWVNRRLQYTHGYGVAASPVNEFSQEGLPTLWVQDVPPRGMLKVDRPEIYYGEKTRDYVIVNTNVDEFDYPKGDANEFTQFQGEGGVKLNSFLRKILYAWQMADANLLLTTQITGDSRILYYRQIQERINHIAPFIMLDKDPYIVIGEGKLYWIQDAYTVSDKYPYSTPFDGRLNYIRNSVKVVMSAYDGTMSFYISDPTDPIINTYTKIFPDLFKPLDQMPADLRAHMRYPEDMFNVMATMYQLYHMKDARVFYTKEDAWDRPKEVYLQKEQPMQAYYVIMKLPGETKPEFMLMLPFTPAGLNKPNAIGWLSARSDGANYGKLLAFILPKDKQTTGPRQLESRIDQDPTISGQFALWNQGGSRVLRGNLLMIPIENSFVYVEPIYLQSQQSPLPELKRVVFSAGNKIAMDESLTASIARVYTGLAAAEKPSGEQPRAPTTPTPTDGSPIVVAGDVASLVKEVQRRYQNAQDRLRAGDWGAYGAEVKALEETLAKLVEVSTPISSN